MSTHVLTAKGTVRIADSVQSPQGRVRICITGSESAQDSREFNASDLVDKPATYIFNVVANRQYRVWAQWGAIETDPVFYFVKDEPVELREILFE